MKKTTENTIEHFVELLQMGVDAWTEAGKVLVTLLKHNPKVKDAIIEKNPAISMGVLNTLEMVGRGQLHPRLLLSDCPGFLAARKLPLSDQERIISEKIPLVIFKDSGTDTLEVDVKELTKRQAAQVFAPDHIRSEPEQRLWCENRAKSQGSRSGGKGYEIAGGKVFFRAASVGYTAAELARILAEISGSFNTEPRRKAS